MKNDETRTKTVVPTDNRRRNFPVSPLKAIVDMVEKKNALRPNAARGKEVAVPRWFG